MFTGKTINLGIIGWPVEHSMSPAMHGAALEAAGLDYSYIAMPVAPDDLETAVAGLRTLGFRGFNVTIPHKIQIMKLLDSVDEHARMIGAVNTVVIEGGKLRGYNTDSVGFIASLRKRGFAIEGSRVVLLGAGGAARAVVWGLIDGGVRSLAIGVRNPAKASALAEAFREYLDIQIYDWDDAAFKQATDAADLVVNTTPLGMSPRTDEMPPIDWTKLHKNAFVCDLIYNPGKTKFLAAAEKKGCRIMNGEGMLVGQGAAAFRLWTQRDADEIIMSKILKKSVTIQ